MEPRYCPGTSVFKTGGKDSRWARVRWHEWPQLWHNLVDASSGGQWPGAGAASTLVMERSQVGSCVGGARVGGDMGAEPVTGGALAGRGLEAAARAGRAPGPGSEGGSPSLGWGVWGGICSDGMGPVKLEHVYEEGQ